MLEEETDLPGVRPGANWRLVVFQIAANRLRKSRPLEHCRGDHAAELPFRNQEEIYFRQVCRPDHTQSVFSRFLGLLIPATQKFPPGPQCCCREILKHSATDVFAVVFRGTLASRLAEDCSCDQEKSPVARSAARLLRFSRQASPSSEYRA